MQNELLANSSQSFFVSIIIPTYNRDECLINLIGALAVQDYDNFEIIVVDQSEELSNKKRQFLDAYQSKLKYFQIDQKGRSLGKNYGILKANGEIFLFCDDDILPPSGFISVHASHYKNPQIGAVSCRLIEENDPSDFYGLPLHATIYGRFVNRSYSHCSTFVNSLNGGNMSIRKSVIQQCGFFEEHLVGTSMIEEPDYAYRIIKHRYKIYFDSRVSVLHYPQYNGNVALMRLDRSKWLENYLQNVGIYFSKYFRIINLPLVVIYGILLFLKYRLLNQLSFYDGIKLIKCLFKGFKEGFQLYWVNRNKKYFTSSKWLKNNTYGN